MVGHERVKFEQPGPFNPSAVVNRPDNYRETGVASFFDVSSYSQMVLDRYKELFPIRDPIPQGVGLFRVLRGKIVFIP